MEQVTQNTIDIEKVLKSKMGPKARFVPKPLTNWLKHIIHQDEVNKYLWESRHLSGTDWLEECVRYLDMTLELVGEENLPDKNDGKLYTFVSNHPLGGEDGVALGAIIGRHYDGRFRYLVNDILMNLPGLAPVCIPINKTGSQSRNFPAMVEAYVKKVNIAMLFLVDEMYKNVHKTFRVAIGKPIPWQTFDKSKTPQQWAQYVKERVYEL